MLPQPRNIARRIIAPLAEKGMSDQQIADHLGMTAQQVRYIRRTYRVPPGKRRGNQTEGRPSMFSDDELRTRYLAGESLEQLARASGASYYGVRKNLLGQGVKLRRRGWGRRAAPEPGPTAQEGHTC